MDCGRVERRGGTVPGKSISLFDVPEVSAVLQNIELSLLRPTRIGPTQTRVVPIRIAQKRPVLAHMLEVTLQLRPESGKGTLSLLDVSILIRHHETWTSSDVREEGLKAAYFFARIFVEPWPCPIASPLTGCR